MNQSRPWIVVANDDDMRSIWPLGRSLPAGWAELGFTGTAEDCLAHLASSWPLVPIPATPRDGEIRCGLHEYFRDHVVARPDAPALITSQRSWTYRQVWDLVDGLAARLVADGVAEGEIVALHATRSLQFLVGLLAILQARGVVLPVDPELPAGRLRVVLEAATPRRMLGDADLPWADPLPRMPIGIDVDGAGPTGPSSGASVAARTPAYVLFTSGSTGAPKGVLMSHAATTAYARHFASAAGVTGEDRIGWRSPVSVDATVFEIATAAVAGAALVVLPSAAALDAEVMIDGVTSGAVSMLVMVPSLLRYHLEQDSFRAMPSLRLVASVGEQLAGVTADEFRLQTAARLYNLYGPTEAGIGVTAHLVVDPTPGPVPIGRALGDVALWVLDENGGEVRAGTIGELHVGGGQLALGYLGRGDLTASAFRPDHVDAAPGGRLYSTGDLVRRAEDGTIVFVGRRDGQVKVNGVRVELEEIRAAICDRPDVRDAALLANTTASGGMVITACVVWRPDVVADVDGLRTYLGLRLPPAFVPRRFASIHAIPRLANGKVDSSALALLVAPARNP